MGSSFLQHSFRGNLQELRRTDQVLASLQQMFQCQRRGICLMHEWFRRYGTAGASCRCHQRLSEHLTDYDVPAVDETSYGPQL